MTLPNPAARGRGVNSLNTHGGGAFGLLVDFAGFADA